MFFSKQISKTKGTQRHRPNLVRQDAVRERGKSHCILLEFVNLRLKIFFQKKNSKNTKHNGTSYNLVRHDAVREGGKSHYLWNLRKSASKRTAQRFHRQKAARQVANDGIRAIQALSRGSVKPSWRESETEA